MATQQTPSILTLGGDAVTVPRRPSWTESTKVEVLAVVPTLNAGVLTLTHSEDSRVYTNFTKDNYSAATFPTASGYTGLASHWLGPVLPGSQIKGASGATQTSVKSSLTSNMTAALADVTLTALDYGPYGDDISVDYDENTTADSPLVVETVGNAITVTLASGSTTHSTATIGGLDYTAKLEGVAGDDITVAHVVTGMSTPLTCTVEDTAITVGLATDAGVAASATIGGMVYTAKAKGAAGNSITVRHLGGTSQTLACTVSSSAITVQLATDGAGAVTSTGAQVIAIIAATPAATALVSATGTTPTVVTATNLANGAQGAVASTGAQVIAKIAATPTANALVSVTGTTPSAASATNLANGSDAFPVASTAAQVAAAINADFGAKNLVVATHEGNGSGLVNAMNHAHLTGGVDYRVRLYFSA